MSDKNSVRRDLVVNFISSIGTTLAFMVVIRICGRRLDVQALGMFLLIRRVGETLSNIAQLGVPFTLRRSVAMATNEETRQQYLWTGVCIASGSCALLFLIAKSITNSGAHWLLGPQGTPSLLFLTISFTSSLVAHNVASSLLSATRRFGILNAFTFINSAGWPLLALAATRDDLSVACLITTQSIGTLLLTGSLILFLGTRQKQENLAPHTGMSAKSVVRTFVNYGFPRILSPFADSVIFGAGPWLIRHDLKQAGFLALALMVLRVGQTTVSPVAIVVGTHVARLLSQNRGNIVRDAFSLMFGTLLFGTIFAFAALTPWLPKLVSLWLGDSEMSDIVATQAKLLFIAAVPFTIFQGLKEPVEMIFSTPYNLIATLTGALALFITYFLTGLFLPPQDAILVSYITGATTTLCVCFVTTFKYLKQPAYYQFPILLTISLVIGMANYGGYRLSQASSLLLCIGLMVILNSLLMTGSIAWLYFSRKKGFLSDFFKLFEMRPPANV